MFGNLEACDFDSDSVLSSSGEDEYERVCYTKRRIHRRTMNQAKAYRHIIKNPQSMIDMFCMEKKRNDEIYSEVLNNVDRCFDQVKQRRGLKLSWDRLVSLINVALLTRDKHHRLIKKLGTLEVTMGQIIGLKGEDELKDRKSRYLEDGKIAGQQCTNSRKTTRQAEE